MYRVYHCDNGATRVLYHCLKNKVIKRYAPHMAGRLCERVVSLMATEDDTDDRISYAALYAVANACSALRRANGAIATRRRCRCAAAAFVDADRAHAHRVVHSDLSKLRLSAWAPRDAKLALATGYATLATGMEA